MAVRRGGVRERVGVKGGLWEPAESRLPICTLEAMALIKGFRAAVKTLRLSPREDAVRIWCDNRVVVSMVRRGHGGGRRSREIMGEWLELMEAGWRVEVGWLSTTRMGVADGMSRGMAAGVMWGMWERGETDVEVLDDVWVRQWAMEQVVGSLGLSLKGWKEVFAGSRPQYPWTTSWGQQIDSNGLHPNGLDLMSGEHAWWQEEGVMWVYPPLPLLEVVLERLWELLRKPRKATLVLVTPPPTVERWHLGPLPGRAKKWVVIPPDGICGNFSMRKRTASNGQLTPYGAVVWRL